MKDATGEQYSQLAVFKAILTYNVTRTEYMRTTSSGTDSPPLQTFKPLFTGAFLCPKLM